jgi:hypothetical protein
VCCSALIVWIWSGARDELACETKIWFTVSATQHMQT